MSVLLCPVLVQAKQTTGPLACGAVIQAGDTHTLTADVTCGIPGTPAVTVNGGTLNLNRHMVSGDTGVLLTGSGSKISRGRIYGSTEGLVVADSGNHKVRLVEIGGYVPLSVVSDNNLLVDTHVLCFGYCSYITGNGNRFEDSLIHPSESTPPPGDLLSDLTISGSHNTVRNVAVVALALPKVACSVEVTGSDNILEDNKVFGRDQMECGLHLVGTGNTMKKNMLLHFTRQDAKDDSCLNTWQGNNFVLADGACIQ
jgi:hypothetical protein